jgi:Uma2 family endonuclease
MKRVEARLMMTSLITSPAQEQEWPEQGQWTYDYWLRLPDDGWRYEVIDGVLFMAPPPNSAHSDVSSRLTNALMQYVYSRKLGNVYTAPRGVALPNQPVPVQPDLLYVRAERRSIIGSQNVEGAPDLIVEILSPSNWTYDRRDKFLLYQDAGVPEYWIVDPRAKTVEVFVLEGEEYELCAKWGLGETAVSRVLSGFQVPVDEVFADLE